MPAKKQTPKSATPKPKSPTSPRPGDPKAQSKSKPIAKANRGFAKAAPKTKSIGSLDQQGMNRYITFNTEERSTQYLQDAKAKRPKGAPDARSSKVRGYEQRAGQGLVSAQRNTGWGRDGMPAPANGDSGSTNSKRALAAANREYDARYERRSTAEKQTGKSKASMETRGKGMTKQAMNKKRGQRSGNG